MVSITISDILVRNLPSKNQNSNKILCDHAFHILKTIKPSSLLPKMEGNVFLFYNSILENGDGKLLVKNNINQNDLTALFINFDYLYTKNIEKNAMKLFIEEQNNQDNYITYIVYDWIDPCTNNHYIRSLYSVKKM